MNKLIIIASLIVSFSLSVQSEEENRITNLTKNAPYSDSGFGKKKIVDQDYLLMMQAALKPGQMVPQHKANANVHLVILEGEVIVNLDGKEIIAKSGDLVPVVYKTPMNIKNKSKANATFLIIKTTHPRKMEK